MHLITRILVALSLMLLATSSAFAESSEWKSKIYDFSKVKKVMITYNISGDIKYPFAQQKIPEIIDNSLKKTSLVAYTEDDINRFIERDIGTNMKELRKTSPLDHWLVFAENLPKYVDCQMVIDIHALGWSEQYISGSVIPITTNEITTHNGSYNGRSYSGWSSTPTTKYYYTSGGFYTYDNAAAGIALYDASNNKLVWGYTDARSRQKRWHDSTGPESMLFRILNSGLDKAPLSVNK